jgi:hypothetical protein
MTPRDDQFITLFPSYICIKTKNKKTCVIISLNSLTLALSVHGEIQGHGAGRILEQGTPQALKVMTCFHIISLGLLFFAYFYV